MSKPESTPSSKRPKDEVFGKAPSARRMTHYIRPTLWVIVLVYVVIFLLLNRAKTQINFLFFTAEAPLIVALLVMFILGIVVGGGILMLRSRRDRRVAERSTASGRKSQA